MHHLPGSPRHRASWAAAVLLGAVSAATAQSQAPHIGYVYPAGGQRGATFKIAVGGQQLREVTDATVSGAGVTVKSIEVVNTLNWRQRASLMKSLATLERARPSIEIVDTISEIRRQLATQTPSSPALADTVVVEVAVARDAATGPRELRLGTRSGLSNPLLFSIGSLPEVTEGAMPEVPLDVQVLRAAGEPVPLPEPQNSGPILTKLPAVVNGQILPGSTGRYRFRARRGQKIVVVVEARDLIPYLADGVPGWFQAAVSVRDTKGRELGYADHYRFHADPVLCVEIPDDGEYLVEVRDSIYRGREDFVYRMILGELPFVTDIFPLGCKAGTRAKIEVRGWNLPADRITQETTALAPGMHLLSLFPGSQVCNRVTFEVGDTREILEARSHGSQADAQAVTLPVVINGRIDAPGQWDVYRFQARAGEEVVAQVTARRLGSPLDSVLMLMDASGKQVAANDDYGDNRDAGLETHHADSYIRAHIATGGTFYLYLGDIQQQGGPEYAYRLRVGAPRPDFELRVAPSAINLNPGQNVPVAVYAVRKDGFAGDIDLSLKAAPAGLILNGGRLGASQDSAFVTLVVPGVAPRGRIALCLQGRATIDGREVLREAMPAEDMMQAFLWRHLVPALDLSANVSSWTASGRPIKLVSELPVAIPAGSSTNVLVDVDTQGIAADGPVQFELVDPPEGISVQSAEPVGDIARMVIACDSKKLKPGFRANLIAVASVTVTPPPRAPVATKHQPVRAAMIKEAPPLPDSLSLNSAQPDPDLDRMSAEGDARAQAKSMKAAPKPQPAPVLLEPQPPQKIALGVLPAIRVEVVQP